MSTREGQNHSKSKQVHEQKAIERAEMIAKLARKLKSISNPNSVNKRKNWIGSSISRFAETKK